MKHTLHHPHSMASTIHMYTAISPRKWQPWTAVSSLLGLINQHGIASGPCMIWKPCFRCPLLPRQVKQHSCKHQLNRKHVGTIAVGWWPHSSPPKACIWRTGLTFLLIGVPNNNKQTIINHEALTTPSQQYGQYLTHAHSHITWAEAARDVSCFMVVRTHQHGIAIRWGWCIVCFMLRYCLGEKRQYNAGGVGGMGGV